MILKLQNKLLTDDELEYYHELSSGQPHPAMEGFCLCHNTLTYVRFKAMEKWNPNIRSGEVIVTFDGSTPTAFEDCTDPETPGVFLRLEFLRFARPVTENPFLAAFALSLLPLTLRIRGSSRTETTVEVVQ